MLLVIIIVGKVGVADDKNQVVCRHTAEQQHCAGGPQWSQGVMKRDTALVQNVSLIP